MAFIFLKNTSIIYDLDHLPCFNIKKSLMAALRRTISLPQHKETKYKQSETLLIQTISKVVNGKLSVLGVCHFNYILSRMNKFK